MMKSEIKNRNVLILPRIYIRPLLNIPTSEHQTFGDLSFPNFSGGKELCFFAGRAHISVSFYTEPMGQTLKLINDMIFCVLQARFRLRLSRSIFDFFFFFNWP